MIAPISVQAAVISESLGVPAAIDLVVRLIEASKAHDEIAFLVALEAGSRHDVEDSVGAVAVVGIITAPLHFDVVDVLRIDLRPDVAGDIGIGNGDAVNQPADLVAAANVEHVVDHISAGNVVRDHGHAVGSVRPWGVPRISSRLNIVVVVTLSVVATTGSPDTRVVWFTPASVKLEMQHRAGVRLNDDILFSG